MNDTSWPSEDSTSVGQLGPDFDNRVAQLVTYGLLLNEHGGTGKLGYKEIIKACKLETYPTYPKFCLVLTVFYRIKKTLLWRTFRFQTQCTWTVAVGNMPFSNVLLHASHAHITLISKTTFAGCLRCIELPLFSPQVLYASVILCETRTCMFMRAVICAALFIHTAPNVTFFPIVYHHKSMHFKFCISPRYLLCSTCILIVERIRILCLI